MSVLLELAAKCEAAMGPDRELDACIAEAAGVVSEDYKRAKVYGETRPYFWHKWERDGEIIPDRYTASLDAAMTLVPEGCGFEVGSAYGGDIIARGHTYALNGRFEARVYTPRDGSFDNEAATPALALCAAALRARSILEGEG